MMLPRQLEVSVTQDDIDQGEMSHACRCPIARAASRAMGINVAREVVYVGANWFFGADGIRRPLITMDTGELDDHGEPVELRLILPAEADDFIMTFDDGQPVEPAVFTAFEYPEASYA